MVSDTWSPGVSDATGANYVQEVHRNVLMQNTSSPSSGCIPDPDFGSENLLLQLTVLVAMNKAIVEVVSTTLKRSVSLASQTAVELVLKDYINDPDEETIYKASSFMAASLAGSLSYATCQEPLRILMSTHLRNSAKGLNFPSEFIEDATKRVVDEKLHLSCSSIEKEETEKYFDNGTEESILVVATCLDHFDIYEDDLGSTDLEPTIASLFRNFMQKPHFSMTFSGLMRNRFISEEFYDNLSIALKLSVSEKVGFGLALLDSEYNDVRIEGRNFCMSQCEALCDNDDTLDMDAAEVLDVLRNLEQSEVLSKYVDSFKVMILEVWLNVNSRFILADEVPDVKLLRFYTVC